MKGLAGTVYPLTVTVTAALVAVTVPGRIRTLTSTEITLGSIINSKSRSRTPSLWTLAQRYVSVIVRIGSQS